MKEIFFDTEQCGWYAYAENDVLVIGESFPHEGGDLYRGDYKGKDTPYLLRIKEDCPRIYKDIVKYFEKDINSTSSIKYLSNMERLKKVFKDCTPRNINTDLYYAVLAVVDEDKTEESLTYFKNNAKEYLA